MRIHRAIVTIGILVILGLSFYHLARHLGVGAQVAVPDPSVTGIDIQLIPHQPTLQAQEPVDVDVWVYPNGNQVTAAEVRINYDPLFLLPASDAPFTPGQALSLVLPNCDAYEADPCPATSSATPTQALIYLGVPCQENGCPFPNPQSRFLLATLHLVSTASASGITAVSPTSEKVLPTLAAATEFDFNAIKTMSHTTLSFTECPLPYDFIPNGSIDITDIMSAASIWTANHQSPEYNGQFDVNRDGQIDVADIQSIANAWNTSCTK